jgi:hypothetical protein
VVSIALVFGISVAPITVSANEDAVSAVYSEESAKKEELATVSYLYNEGEGHLIVVDIHDGNSALMRMIERHGDGSTEIARLNATYTIDNGILSISAMEGAVDRSFFINNDYTLTPLDDGGESDEKENENTGVETTFEDFLEWSKKEAERYGYGNEYDAAIEAVKTAATQKQVTLSTIASTGLAIAVIALIVVQKVKEKNLKKAIIEVASSLEKQREGTNNLITGANDMAKTETETNTETKKAKEEILHLERSFSSFLSAFLRFTDGVKMSENKKTEVQTNCLNALKELNGEVSDNEGNKN